MRYAIFGATGPVGKALAKEFAASGTPFRVVGRSENTLRRDFSAYEPLVEYVQADLADGAAALKAAAGVHTVIYTVGVPYDHFELHPELMRKSLEAAQSAGVARFVHVSNVYPYGLPQTPFVSESHPRDPHTFKGRMRKEQEDLVLGADGQRGLRTLILRPPDFYGPGAGGINSVFIAALKGGSAAVVGPVDTMHEFIHVPDLARTLIALSRRDEAYGSTWNIAGPEPITTRQFAALVFAAVGKKPHLQVAGKMLLRAIGLLNPIMRELVEMHYLWTRPVLLDDTRIRKLLAELRKTPYEEGIRATLDAMRAEPGRAATAA